MNPAISAGVVAKVTTLADGSPRLTVDFNCTLAELVAVIGGVGQPIAIAALAPDSKPQPPSDDFDGMADTFGEEKPKGGDRSRQAAMICNDEAFKRYSRLWRLGGKADAIERHLCEEYETTADFVRRSCGIKSRAELDHNDEAWGRFRELMRGFNEWKLSEKLDK